MSWIHIEHPANLTLNSAIVKSHSPFLYPPVIFPKTYIHKHNFCQGNMKTQMVGPFEFRGVNLTEQEFEYLLGKTGAIDTKIKEDPKPKVMMISLFVIRGK